MQWLMDFITLKFFVTPYVILLIYWFGALVVPLAVWLLCRWLLQKARQHDITATGLEEINRTAQWLLRSPHLRLFFWTAFGFGFLLAELLWRMLFEFLIAYFHIHDALIQLVRQQH